MPNKVFISYRREDSQYQARRIYDAFVHALPPDTVFMDVDSIAPGADFVEILEGWVQQCDILLALIGPRWLDSIDSRTNLRRLDNPEDFVRIEIRGALERKIPVVPVLLDATGMPTATELPDDIKALRRKHAEFVDFRTFDADVQRLIKRLKIGKKTELPGVAAGLQAGYNVVRGTVVAAVKPFFQPVKPDAMAAKPLLFAAAVASLLLAVGAVAYVMSTAPHLDASADLADFAKSEEGRRTAEARASQTADALGKADKARQEAEATAAAAAAAQAKSEEGRRAAETRAGEASDALARAEKEAEAQLSATSSALAQAEAARKAAEKQGSDATNALTQSQKARQDADARAIAMSAALEKSNQALQAADAKATAAAAAQAKAETALQEAEARARKNAGAKGVAQPDTLLDSIGPKSRWTRAYDGSTCKLERNYLNYTLEVNTGSITWRDSLGNGAIESIISSNLNEFRTTKGGQSWTYSSEGDRIRVTVGPISYPMTRCP